MGEVSTIGIDIAKSVFQVHGVDTDGTVVIRKRIGRTKILKFFTDLPPWLVWRRAQPLTIGHESLRGSDMTCGSCRRLMSKLM